MFVASDGFAKRDRRRRRREPVSARHSTLEQEVSTAPAQRWVAAGNGARSLALLAPGFFEYEWTADGVLVCVAPAST